MAYVVYLTINIEKEKLYQSTKDKIYETTKYIGSTTLNNNSYFGSSKWLEDDISNWGVDSFKRTTLFTLLNDDPILLLKYEKQIQIIHNVVNSNRFYNKVLATEKFTPSNFIWYHNPTTDEKGKFHKDIIPPVGWIKRSGYCTIKNKKAYYHVTSKQVKFFNEIPDNMWTKGLPTGNTTGKLWYYNPNDLQERGCYTEGEQPKNWIRGMGDLPNHPYKNNKRIWYYNPKTQERGRVLEGKQPIGWIRGSGHKTRTGEKWYHNPNNPQERGFFKDNAPNGWIRGKGFVSGGRPKNGLNS